MGKLKIKFQPLFALYVFVCIYFNWFNKVFYYVLTVTLHEYGHFFVAKHYGYKIDSMIYSLSGAGITTKEEFKTKDEIKIALAGPIVNVVLILLIVCLWWIVPLSYLYTYDFLMANVFVLIFNLLPLYPLDGGRIIVSLGSLKFNNKKRLIRISKILSLTFGILFFILFIISLFFATNFNLLITGVFLILNSITCDKNKYYDKIQTFNKKQKEPMEVKVFRVSVENKKQLIKYLSPSYISIFENNCNGKQEIVREEDLIK